MAENHLGSRNLTESLVTLIRQQRHYGVRVLVSTQEPSINPKFIELSNISVIHNFASPEWLDKLYERMSIEDGIAGKEELLEKIVALDTGEALISCPAAMVGGVTQSSLLGAKLLKAKIRRRVTWDVSFLRG